MTDAWDTDRIWRAIETERRRLADDLAGLTDAQWQTRSLCAEWTVEQVVAHLSAAARIGRWRWLRSVAAARGDFAVHNARRLSEVVGPAPADTLRRFTEAAGLRIEPARKTWAWLGEVVVHGQDCRLPLGLATEPDPAAVELVAGHFATADFAVPSATAARGLRLVAEDSGFRAGDGPEVRGRTLDLVLAMAERPAVLDRLTGDGVAVLADRLG